MYSIFPWKTQRNTIMIFSPHLQAHFISDLPDIDPLTNTITYLNLSFNDLRVSVLWCRIIRHSILYFFHIGYRKCFFCSILFCRSHSDLHPYDKYLHLYFSIARSFDDTLDQSNTLYSFYSYEPHRHMHYG